MKSLDLGRYALSIDAAAALLAGCGSSQPPIGVPGATPQIPAIATHVDHGSSRMAPQAKGEDLLYVTRESVVAVYSYPRGTLEGLLTRFSYSLGDCVDKNGKIYITDYTENTIAEYAHGGTQPIKTLSVPGSGPVACAVDPASGDLAVTSAGNSSGGANLAVYSKAKGTPKTYTDPAILNYGYCTYDDAGNLFVDGSPAQGHGYDYELARLPRGGNSLQAVTIQYGLSWGAGLQWDGHYLAIGQPVVPHILRYTISGGYGTYAGSTPLSGAYDAFQFIIAGKKAIVANLYYYDRYITRWDVLVFKYPAGGSDTQEILASDTPVGSVALSRRRK